MTLLVDIPFHMWGIHVYVCIPFFFFFFFFFFRSNVPCCLFWKSPDTLLVGRGHLVKVGGARKEWVVITPAAN